MNGELTRAYFAPPGVGEQRRFSSLHGDDSVKKHEVRGYIEGTGIIAAIRVYGTVPQATDVIAHLLKTMPGVVVGAGSVTNATVALECIEAGAHF